MSTKTKSAPAAPPAAPLAADPEAEARRDGGDPEIAVRTQDAIDLNDPHVSGQEAVARNLKGED